MKKIKYFYVIIFNMFVSIIFIYNLKSFSRTHYDNQNTNTIFYGNNKYILVEVISDDIIHIETAYGEVPKKPFPIYTTPMVSKDNKFNGPTFFKKNDTVIETANLVMKVDLKTFCISYYNKKLNYNLADICSFNMDKSEKNLQIKSAQNQNVYGLGQYFYDPRFSDGDWIGRKWEPGEFGNSFVGFSGGANSKVQFPILYALGNEKQNYALFLDNQYKTSWDFTDSNSWSASMWGDQLRYFIIAGNNLEQLRHNYLSITGFPAIPPKKMVGLWLSEFGYRNWNEIDNKLNSLRNNYFPIDGFALDLFWFGGQRGMGSLTFDQNNFPNAAEKINYYKEQGIEFIPIQEPYIALTANSLDSNISVFDDLKNRCFLVRQNPQGCDPISFTNNFWGTVGMIDWTNDNAADYWFEKKEVPLINLGLTNFWLDLNEPEMYNPNAYYSGFIINNVLKNRHADVANLYAFKWIESLDRGFSKHKYSKRPIFMSRAGAPGIQRFGGGMWSGDIGANLGALKAHINNQTNVSLSGIDFYSADTGGFHRESFDGSDINKLYTQWFSNATLFDFPVRPHTWVGEASNSETSPSLIGDINSNKENLLQRYSLAKYYYSLFYRAHLFGEAVIPPLVTLFQDDNNVRKISSEKMIGKFLLGVAMSQYHDPIRRNIYLPEGRWLNYHTLDEITNTGKIYIDYPVYLGNKYKSPLFVREGAIIPQNYIDNNTLNIVGLRRDRAKIDDLIIKIVPSKNKSEFILYEDDGYTTDYKLKKYSQTLITQEKIDDNVTVKIAAQQGSYLGMPLERKQSVEIATPNEFVENVSINNIQIQKCLSDNLDNCWYQTSRNSIIVKKSKTKISESNTYLFKLKPLKNLYSQYSFTCYNANTKLGESIYIIGNIQELGNWDTKNAIKLFPVEYPTWSGYINNIPSNTYNIQWKCLKKNDTTGEVLEWQPDPNDNFNSIKQGFGGNLFGKF